MTSSSEYDAQHFQDLATQFRHILSISKGTRTDTDVDIIYGHLREIQCLSQLPEPSIRQMARTARYQIHESNEVLYMAGDISTCWYVLLSGSVHLEGCIYLPGNSFGQKTKSGSRSSECLILERSEMIVIDYPSDNVLLPYNKHRSYSSDNLDAVAPYNAHLVDGMPTQSQQMISALKTRELDRITTQPDKTNYNRPRSHSSLDDFDLSGLKETVEEVSLCILRMHKDTSSEMEMVEFCDTKFVNDLVDGP